MGREFTEFVASNNLCDEDIDIIGTNVMVESVVREVKETVKSVEEEDFQRRLFSLDTSSADKVKLPTFEGKDEEDFQKFKEEIEKAFDTNRVSRADQLTKLRESLRGQAKRMVPESITEDIGKAWEALEKAFGKPLILMTFRRDLIKKLGPIPKINGKGAIKARVEWYLKVEALMQSILDLGRQSPELGHDAFNSETFKSLFNLFPY